MSQSGRLGKGNGGTPSNPLKTITDFDDFLAAGTLSGEIPKLGWSFNNYVQFEGTSNNPGIISGNTGISTHNSLTTSNSANFLLGGSDLSINWVLDLGTLSDNTNRYVFRVGISNFDMSYFTNPTRGCYFQYSDDVNSGNWQLVCVDGGIETIINTAISATIGFHGFGVVVNSIGTSATFYYDGAFVGTILDDIPLTEAVSPFVLSENILGSTPFHYIDLFYYTQVLTNARPGTQTPSGSGGGDVSGPGISTDNALCRFNGITGKLIQNSIAILLDTGELSGLTSLNVNGSQIVKRTTSAISYNVLVSDYYVGITDTSAPRSVVLPVTGATENQIFVVKDESGNASVNNITLSVEGGALIDGVISIPINGDYQSFSCIFDGTNYYTL